MYPHNLARAVTNVAYDGTPVTQFTVKVHFESCAPKWCLCWAYDHCEALEVALERFPCAEWVEVQVA